MTPAVLQIEPDVTKLSDVTKFTDSKKDKGKEVAQQRLSSFGWRIATTWGQGGGAKSYEYTMVWNGGIWGLKLHGNLKRLAKAARYFRLHQTLKVTTSHLAGWPDWR
jgi:hypothetical protein